MFSAVAGSPARKSALSNSRPDARLVTTTARPDSPTQAEREARRKDFHRQPPNPNGMNLAILAAALLPAFAAPQAAGHATRNVQGWTVHIAPALLERQAEATEKALGLLTVQLKEVEAKVPAEAVAKLRQVALWFSPEYPGTGPKAEYHPSAGWLRDNGRNPAMAKAVEFTNIRIFEAETRRMPNFALHELAHAYHDRFLPDGFQNAEIRAAYERAKAGGGYDKVERQDAEGRKTLDKAYALVNPMEFFAETTEAYFSRNDFFPFDAAQLRAHDPETFALLGRLWGVK